MSAMVEQTDVLEALDATRPVIERICAACCGTSIGVKGAVSAAQVLALTALDVLTDDELRAAARADFERRTAGFEYVSPIPAGPSGPRGLQAADLGALRTL